MEVRGNMTVLFIVNDAPYGSEKVYNALRMAMTLQKEHHHVEIYIFLMGDAVTSALPDQSTPQGYYNIERMLKAIVNKGGQVRVCKTCIEARGIKGSNLIEGVEIGTMIILTQWTMDFDRVLTF